MSLKNPSLLQKAYTERKSVLEIKNKEKARCISNPMTNTQRLGCFHLFRILHLYQNLQSIRIHTKSSKRSSIFYSPPMVLRTNNPSTAQHNMTNLDLRCVLIQGSLFWKSLIGSSLQSLRLDDVSICFQTTDEENINEDVYWKFHWKEIFSLCMSRCHNLRILRLHSLKYYSSHFREEEECSSEDVSMSQELLDWVVERNVSLGYPIHESNVNIKGISNK